MKEILKYVHLNTGLLAALVSNEFMSNQEISLKTWPFLVLRIIFAVHYVLMPLKNFDRKYLVLF
jgi:hypothetical protein